MSTYNLAKDMSFNSYQDFSNFIGYDYTNSRSELRSRVKHHCKFHKKGNTIIIDEVFDINDLYKKPILDFLYDIGEIVHVSTGNVKILDKYFVKRKNGQKSRYYKCECIKDKYTYEISQSSLVKGVGCRVCRNQVVLPGVNDIATTHPHIANLMVNESDKHKYTFSSRKKVLFKCPICGYKKMISINTVQKLGRIQCNKCSDNFSYPNKFVYNALSQICNNIECEKIFSWSNKKRYDLFLPTYNMIIENHGRFHYDDKCLMYDQQYEYTNKNDKYKEEIAKNNGIQYYIVIDCRKSDKEWIKCSIMNSELPKLLNFKESDIDWNVCDKFAHSSLLKTIYDFYTNGIKNKSELSRKVGISYDTCCRYLHDAIAIFES